MSSSGNGGSAQQKVNGPAIGLMVTGIIGLLLVLCGLIGNLTGAGFADPAKMQGLSEQQRQMLAYYTGAVGLVSNFIGLAIGLVILLGAMRMKNLQSYGLAMTSSILAMIPCVSPCCILGLPFGIWAVVVLNKPEVKQAFR